MASRIRVFISSKQSEFEAERSVLAHEIRNVPLLEPVLAEEWNPTGTSVHEVYLNDVRTSPIYVGLFGAIYSEPTYLEYLAACENPYREKLIYLKQADNIDDRLKQLIVEFQDRHVPAKFRTLGDLVPVFSQHLIAALGRMITALQLMGEPKSVAQGSGSVLEKRWGNQRQQLKELGLPEGSTPEANGMLIREISETITSLKANAEVNCASRKPRSA